MEEIYIIGVIFLVVIFFKNPNDNNNNHKDNTNGYTFGM